VAVPNFHQRTLEDHIEEDNVSPGYFQIHFPPQNSPDITTPLAYIEKRRADIDQLEGMRERIRQLEQDLRVGSSSTEPGVSCVHGLLTGGQHPAMPFEKHPRNAAAMNLAWQQSLSEGVQLLEPQLHMRRAGLERGNNFTPRAPDAGPVARPWYEDHVGTQPSHELKENAAAITQAWKEGHIGRKAYVPFRKLSALNLGDKLDHF
jgi:hypothetical protein